MAQAGFTPISLYYSATAAAVPTSGNLVAGELALNTLDGKLYYKNSAGTVTLLASTAGAAGDVVGPASATDNALARFDLTTGKLIQNSVGILSDAGILTGLTGLTSSGAITLSSLTSGRVTFATTAGLLTDSANLAFDGTNLGLGGTTNSYGSQTTLTLSGTNVSRIDFRSNSVFTGTILSYQSVTEGLRISTEAGYPITFYPAQTEAGRFTAAGNFGIGTSSPTQKFEVYKAAGDTLSYGSNPRLILTVPTGANGFRVVADTTPFEAVHLTDGSQFSIASDMSGNFNAPNATSGSTTKSSPTIAFLSRYWTGSASASQMQGFIGVTSTAATSTGGYFGLGIGAADALRINSGGIIGVAVTPFTWQSNDYKAIQIGSGGSAIYGGQGSGFSPIALVSNAYVSGGSTVYTYSTNSQSAGYYRIQGDVHTWGTAPAGSGTVSFSTRMTLSINASYAGNGLLQVGTGDTGTAGVRIQVGGHVAASVGTGATDGSGDNLQAGFGWSSTNQADVLAGLIYPNRQGGYGMDMYVNLRGSAGGSSVNRFQLSNAGSCFNSTGTYGTISSNFALKQDIVDASSQWNDIKAIKFKKYRYIADVERAVALGEDPSTVQLQMGVIVEDLMASSPGLVEHRVNTETGEETDAVKYSIMFMKATKALQEAMARIEQLETRLAAANL